ncbi:hypothetical protein BGZ98_006892 [Dissophora globulifera]|nr:hypothetical protein BGZ98_006892 [Dissophora globulifera]
MSNGRSSNSGHSSSSRSNNADRIRNDAILPPPPDAATILLKGTTTTATTTANTATAPTAAAPSSAAIINSGTDNSYFHASQQTGIASHASTVTSLTTTMTVPSMSNSVAATSLATTTPSASGSTAHVSQKTVEALGDWLLKSATVQSLPAAQQERRKQSHKSGALINKTMKQSQEERRKLALAEQAKKRYQFTNHARKLALFASGQPSDGSPGSDTDYSQDDDDDDDEEDDDDDDDNDEDDDNGKAGKSKKKKRGRKQDPTSATGRDADDEATVPRPSGMATAAQKRRLSSGSETDGDSGRKLDRAGDMLSPKKPRLLKKHSPKISRSKKDRNPFRDQMMIPEAMTDIPSDLDTSYYIVPIPIGHRCFVISADGKTTARLPSGQLLVAAFDSCLPAGSSQYRGNRRSDYCILDCVYSSVTRTFWTLDIMCWRGHPVYECETEFRFWWLRGKLAEIESLQAKWVAKQTREWEQEVAKKKQKRARQVQKRKEKAAAAAMDIVLAETFDNAAHEGSDDGDDEAGTESMDYGESTRSMTGGRNYTPPRKFWPIVFTPLPYFNASIDLVRLLAESMCQHSPSLSLTALPDATESGIVPPSTLSSTSGTGTQRSLPPIAASSLLPTFVSPSKLAPATSFSKKPTSPTAMPAIDSGCSNVDRNNVASSSTLGTMALSGEIATAASLFPAHDATQKVRQDQTLAFERAAGLVFFNKKTMYVLGTTPLCGWVRMEQIGDVFFDEEGGIGPVPGTRAVEGREVEMEDALERIRI